MRKDKDEKNRVKTPVRAAAWYFAGGAIGKAAGLIATPIFTRLLSIEEYSTLPLFMTWVGLLGTFTGIAGALGVRGRMVMESERSGEGLSAAFLGFGYLQILVCMLIYFLLHPLLSRLGAPSVGLSLLVFLELFVDCAVFNETTRLKATFGYRRCVAIGIFLSCAPIVISYIIILLFGAVGEARVIGTLIAGGALSVPIILRALKRGRLYDRVVWRELFRSEMPLLPRNIAAALLFSADRLMITAFYGPSALSAYTISHSVGAVGGFIVTALSAALTPWVIRQRAARRSEGICEATDTAAMLLNLFSVLLCCIAPEVLRILAPSGYDLPLFVIAPLALSSVPLFLSGLLTSVAASEGRGGSAALPGALAAVLTIGINALLFSLFPIEVAGVGYFAASLIGLFVADALRVRLGGERLFSRKRLVISLFVGGVLCLVALAYDHSIAMRAVLMLLAAMISLPFLVGFFVRVGIKKPPKIGGGEVRS